MAARITKLRVSYNPELDALYLSTPSCTGKFMDSQDGIYFFMVYNNRSDAHPTGFEVHHLSEVWNDEDLIPHLDMRFDIDGTELKGATLRQVLRWAYERYVARREQRRLEYPLPATPAYQAVREK